MFAVFSAKTFGTTPALLLSLVLLAAGLALTIKGVFFPVLPGISDTREKEKRRNLAVMKFVAAVLDRATSVYPLSKLKARLSCYPVFMPEDNVRLPAITGMLSILVLLTGTGLFRLLYRGGILWYVKLLLVTMSFFLPWHTLFLILDIYSYRIECQIPRLIDEFRSAFVKYGKIRPALLESCAYVDKSLGRIIYRASDDLYMEKSLQKLKTGFNNVWFNIFIILLSNYKQNGGELIEQLYKLNRTMTRYVNVERKRAKRLIWYEVFAVAVSAFSIPSIAWLNAKIAVEADVAGDPRINFIMARLIIFSMFSLFTVRILRRL